MKVNCEINDCLQDLRTEEHKPSQTLWCGRGCQCCVVLLLNFLLYNTSDPVNALEAFREVLEKHRQSPDGVSSAQ